MAKMKASKRRKIGTIVYWSFLTVWVIGLSIAAYYGLSIVWRYAEEYEASQPTNTMDAYMAELNEHFWNSSMEGTIASMPHEMQTDEECRAFIETLLDGGIRYVRGANADPSGNTITYNLKCDSGVIGKVVIAEDKSYEDTVEFGMLPWKVVSDEFDFNGLYTSVTVTVPATYSVELNGHRLGEEYIVESGIHMEPLDAYYDDYPNLPTKVTYKFDRIIGYLDPVIYNENGELTVIDPTLGDAQYLTSADEETVARLQDFVSRFEQKYRRFAAGVSYMAYYDQLLGYINRGSSLDNRFKAAFDGLSWSHTNSVDVAYTEIWSTIQIDSKTWIVEEMTAATSYGPTTEYSETVMNLVIVELSPGDLRIIAMS